MTNHSKSLYVRSMAQVQHTLGHIICRGKEKSQQLNAVFAVFCLNQVPYNWIQIHIETVVYQFAPLLPLLVKCIFFFPFLTVSIFFSLFSDSSCNKNSGTPKSSISIGFSIINHPFWGTPIFGNIHLWWQCHWGLNGPWPWPFTCPCSRGTRPVFGLLGLQKVANITLVMLEYDMQDEYIVYWYRYILIQYCLIYIYSICIDTLIHQIYNITICRNIFREDPHTPNLMSFSLGIHNWDHHCHSSTKVGACKARFFDRKNPFLVLARFSGRCEFYDRCQVSKGLYMYISVVLFRCFFFWLQQGYPGHEMDMPKMAS